MPAESHPKPPVHVVCALIWDGPHILLARRPPDKLLGGLWEFPGGKIDPGESPETALHRELFEELGCRVDISHAPPPVTHTYPWCQILMTPFICRLTPDSPPPQALEHTALAWTPWDLVPTYELAPADLPVLSLYVPT